MYLQDCSFSSPLEPLPFYQKIAVGAVSGFLGGIIGNPADLVNVR